MCSCPCLLYCVPDLWKGQMMSCNLQTAGNNSYSVGRDSAMCSILLSRWTIQNQEGTASGSLLKRRCTTKSAARTAPLLCSLSPTIPRNPFCESIFNRQHPINSRVFEARLVVSQSVSFIVLQQGCHRSQREIPSWSSWSVAHSKNWWSVPGTHQRAIGWCHGGWYTDRVRNIVESWHPISSFVVILVVSTNTTIAWIDVQEWGEGGEAKLRRLPDGSFDLLTSAKRGGASSGYGTSLNSLSDGARLEVCSKIMQSDTTTRHYFDLPSCAAPVGTSVRWVCCSFFLGSSVACKMHRCRLWCWMNQNLAWTVLNSCPWMYDDLCTVSLLCILETSKLIDDGRQTVAIVSCVSCNFIRKDSRLDKRHASALRRYLQKPDGPKQCLWLSQPLRYFRSDLLRFAHQRITQSIGIWTASTCIDLPSGSALTRL